jgi:hypothetical protein
MPNKRKANLFGACTFLNKKMRKAVGKRRNDEVRLDYEIKTKEQVQKEVEELNRDGHGAILYDWEYEKPAQVLSSSEVRDAVVSLRKDYQEMRSSGGESDESIRISLRQMNPLYDRLASQNSHETIFKFVTDSTTTSEKLAVLMEMIDIRAKVERGDVKEMEAAVQAQTAGLQISTKKKD